MRKLIVLLVFAISVGCGEQETVPETLEAPTLEAWTQMGVSVIRNIDQIDSRISEHVGPIANKALQVEAGLDFGSFYYGPDAFGSAMQICSETVHLLGLLEYFALQDGSVLSDAQEGIAHPGIAYGSARSYMSQACIGLKSAQSSMNAAVHGLDTNQRPDLIAYLLRESNSSLAVAADSMHIVVSVLPAVLP